MSDLLRCPDCGAPLSLNAPEGLCPACLMKVALQTDPGAETERITIDEPATEQGQRFGPYQTMRLLGQGGMGMVYLARQDHPIQRTVALKVIKPGMDSRQVIARFESERQALAMMDHPNIAHVFDAGTAEDGRPYFVMEFVSGVPITSYCDTNQLTNRERLELFRQVCLGVHHAHQKGIIHRDLKPSNVLVTVQDGKPVPKIIDFGVAKATSQRLSEHTLFTEQGVLVGTPEYMSPEQADLSAHEVDTASDIYSLGVLLYELIAGVLPFDSRELRHAGYLEILRKIREDDPPPLATRVKTMGVTAAEVAKRRHTDVHTLQKQLRGDLEWITMRAIEKDRRRRYLSASELAADIDRHLNDEPVLAGPPSRLYRMRKFVRKNRLSVALVVTIAICVLTALAASIILYFREQRQRDIAERQSYVANLASADALIEAADFEGARERLFKCAPRLRGWEWRLVYSLSDTSVARLHGNGDPLEEFYADPRFGFSRDGKRLFFNMLRSVHVWEIGSWQPVGDYGVSGRILAMSQDGATIVVRPRGGAETGLLVLETVSGHRVAVLHNHSNASAGVFSPDGNRVVTASSDDGLLRIWDTRSGRLLASATTRSGERLFAPRLAFSPDGRYVACASFFGTDAEFQIVEARSGRKIRVFRCAGPKGSGIRALAFSPDGTRITAGYSTGSIRTWSVVSAEPLRTLGDTSAIFELAFNRDGTRMATATLDRSIRIWDVASGMVLASLPGGMGSPSAVAFSPDGKWIMAGFQAGEVWIWDASTFGGSMLARIDSKTVALSPDGQRIATTIDRSTAVLDAGTGHALLRYPVPASAAAFNRLGDRLAIGGSNGRIEIIDLETGAKVLSWAAHEGAVFSVDFDRAGQYVASSSSDGSARIWNASTAAQVAKIELPATTLSRTRVAFHPTRDVLATSATLDSSVVGVRLWHVPSGKLFVSVAARSLVGPYSEMLTFSPDGGRIASNDTFDRVRVSDTATGGVLAILKGAPAPASSVAFSPDGKLIATGSAGEIRLWDAVRYELLLTLRRPGTYALNLAFSPDGSRLYSVCLDRAFPGSLVLRVWDTGAARTSTARELVAQLGRNYPLLLDVRRHLENDPGLDESARSAALQMCWPGADGLGPLTEQVDIPLLHGTSGRSELIAALRRSEAYYRLFAVSSDGPMYLGMAQYRSQLYQEAVSNLTRAIAAGSEDPATDAFLAMALYRTGRIDAARESLDRARIMLKDTDPFRLNRASAVDEAEALLSGKSTSREPSGPGHAH